MQRHHRHKTVLLAGQQHISVVLNLLAREDALLRLDPCPFDGETVTVETQLCQKRDILAIAVIMIAGEPARFFIKAARNLLHDPGIGVGVVSLYLGSGSRGSPEKEIRID